MSSLNKVTLIGRLGKDPEVLNFQNGGKVVNFSLATSERWKDRDGNPKEKTEWHNIAVTNEKLADIAERYLRKGALVYIEGQMQTRKWQDQSGNDRYSTEVALPAYRGAIVMLGPKDAGGDGDDAQFTPTRRDIDREARSLRNDMRIDDDLPF
jgi:single-strand DNA-binding protein